MIHYPDASTLRVHIQPATNESSPQLAAESKSKVDDRHERLLIGRRAGFHHVPDPQQGRHHYFRI